VGRVVVPAHRGIFKASNEMSKYQLIIISLSLIVVSASSQPLVLDTVGSKPVKIYYRQDSTIDHLLYEWDMPHSSDDDIKAFTIKYKVLYTEVFHAYGGSKGEGNLDLFIMKDTWKPDDSTEIELQMDPSYRIILQVRNIVSPMQADDKVLRAFLSELQNKNFSKAKTYLSVRISNTITGQQFDSLRQNIRLDDSLIIYRTETQVATDHSTNAILQYRYKTDQDQPPKELIRVMFDKNNKILGIQPIKKQ
jgi:hypothetical protein